MGPRWRGRRFGRGAVAAAPSPAQGEGLGAGSVPLLGWAGATGSAESAATLGRRGASVPPPPCCGEENGRRGWRLLHNSRPPRQDTARPSERFALCWGRGTPRACPGLLLMLRGLGHPEVAPGGWGAMGRELWGSLGARRERAPVPGSPGTAEPPRHLWARHKRAEDRGSRPPRCLASPARQGRCRGARQRRGAGFGPV